MICSATVDLLSSAFGKHFLFHFVIFRMPLFLLGLQGGIRNSECVC